MEAKILKSTKMVVNKVLKLQRPLTAAFVGQNCSNPCYSIDILRGLRFLVLLLVYYCSRNLE